MTSNEPWEPHSEAFAQVEDALRSSLERGTSLHIPEPRDLDPLQVRGQDCVSQKAERGLLLEMSVMMTALRQLRTALMLNP